MTKKISLRLILLNIRNLFKNRYANHPIFRWFKIIVISVFIACSMFFGYLFFVYTFSTYITFFLFIILIGLLFWFIIGKIVKIFRKPDTFLKTAKIFLLTSLAIFLCVETILRMEGSKDSFNEIQKFYYVSGFNKKLKCDKHNPDLLVYPKYHNYIDCRKEFSFEIKANNEGLRDIDHSMIKAKDEYRIICIGNSFTEGIGTPQDSTWPKLLEDRLKLVSRKKVTVFNAGKAGSDPFFGYRLFEKKMLKYNPDIVLVAISSSDYDFYRFRGGFERFTLNGYRFRKQPWWEKFYAISYICRFITDDLMNYKYFLTPEEYKKDSINAMKDINDCIHKFYKLAQNNNFKLAVVYCDDGIYKLDPVLNFLKKEKTIPVIDLVEYTRCIEKLTPVMRKDYYWPLDGHCNSKGYNLFAKGVEWNLENKGIVDSLFFKN